MAANSLLLLYFYRHRRRSENQHRAHSVHLSADSYNAAESHSQMESR